MKDFDTDIRPLLSKRLTIEEQGHPNDYLGVNITMTKDGQHVFTQPSLIDAIINDVGNGTKQRKPVLVSFYIITWIHNHTIHTTSTTDQLWKNPIIWQKIS